MSDIRNKRTERAICQAMLDLMKEKPFARLSVTDVATAAGISRSTFYAHYANLEEVFSALVREFHDTVRNLGVHLHCAADIEDANMQKRPYCMALRDAGSFEPLVKDPHYQISDADMEALMAIEHSDYGQAAVFPVYGGKLR